MYQIQPLNQYQWKNQINWLQGKAKNPLKTTVLVCIPFIKVSQNDHFWVDPNVVLLERFHYTHSSLQ